MTSVIWLPIVYTGLRLVIGSWNIIETSFPRIFLNSFSVISSILCPLKRIVPPTSLPGYAVRPIIEYAVTDFPEPDSPTIPRTSPSSIEKETPLRAFTSPAGVKNDSLSSLISNSFSLKVFVSLLSFSAWDRTRRAVRHRED